MITVKITSGQDAQSTLKDIIRWLSGAEVTHTENPSDFFSLITARITSGQDAQSTLMDVERWLRLRSATDAGDFCSLRLRSGRVAQSPNSGQDAQNTLSARVFEPKIRGWFLGNFNPFLCLLFTEYCTVEFAEDTLIETIYRILDSKFTKITMQTGKAEELKYLE